MKFLILFPDNKKAVTGNLCSALQYQIILQDLGHRVELANRYIEQDAEVLIAINADKNNSDIRKFNSDNPQSKIILILSGTDIYPEPSAKAIDSMKVGNVLVLLQSHGIDQVPPLYRNKSTIIYQSIEKLSVDSERSKSDSEFRVVLISNITSVKEPQIASRACRLISPASKMKITDVGYCLDEELGSELTQENRSNIRYEWVGGLSKLEAMTILSESHVLLITSQHEGAGRVVGEAIQLGVPIISTNNLGVTGILGDDYEGYYPVGDAKALSDILTKAEEDKEFLAQLNVHCQNRSSLFDIEEEKKNWEKLINDFSIV
ncbi:MAG: glycosyltransferase [Verrucomicrobiota bacterium]|nr:glycosyltransferase [Verrucomicrobiota bacterium]